MTRIWEAPVDVQAEIHRAQVARARRAARRRALRHRVQLALLDLLLTVTFALAPKGPPRR